MLLFAQKTTSPLLLNNNIAKFTQKERDTLSNVTDGFLIFNLSSGCFNYYFQQKWLEICGTCEKPVPFITKKENGVDEFTFFMQPLPLKTTYIVNTVPTTTVIIDSTGILHFINVRENTNYTISISAKNECGTSLPQIENYLYKGKDACEGISLFTDNKTKKSYTTSIYHHQCWLNNDLFFIASDNKYNKEIEISKEGKTYYSIEYLIQEDICPAGWHIPEKEEVVIFQKNYQEKKGNTAFFSPNGIYNTSLSEIKNKDQMYLFFYNKNHDVDYSILKLNAVETELIQPEEKNKYAVRCIKDKSK